MASIRKTGRPVVLADQKAAITKLIQQRTPVPKPDDYTAWLAKQPKELQSLTREALMTRMKKIRFELSHRSNLTVSRKRDDKAAAKS